MRRNDCAKCKSNSACSACFSWRTNSAYSVTDRLAGVVSNNVYDVFGVLRHPRGSLPPSGKRVTIYPN